jgi:hypothetical protein
MGAGALATAWTTQALAGKASSPHYSYPQRVIHFPRDMGWIQPTKDFGCDNIIEAHGDVMIPAGECARLIMFDCDAFPFLRALKPNDIQELLCWFIGGTVCFDHIQHLSGLQTLEITDATIVGHIDLNRFAMLQDLTLYGTGISESRITGLRQDFPYIHIDWQR